MTDWHWLDDDGKASDDDAAQYPDAVYDAADDEWRDILGLDDDDSRGDVADYDDSDNALGSPDDWGWDEWPDYWDGDYYEVELGIDYGEDS